MSSIASPTDASVHAPPSLRLVHDAEERERERGQREQEHSPVQSPPGGHSTQVLVAGSDMGARARMLDELRNMLPASTGFLEACETWELLARAASSRMVVLTDDLGDVSTESLVRLLGRRHPSLPVLAIGGRARSGAPADADVASA